MSLAGFAPMYAGRSGGWCLVRALYGRVVYDSIACVRMSQPAAAVTSGGAVSVLSGSTIPTAGRRRRCETPAFTWWARTWVTATAVVSLPVPAVVGTAINGLSGPGTGRPLPTGWLM